MNTINSQPASSSLIENSYSRESSSAPLSVSSRSDSSSQQSQAQELNHQQIAQFFNTAGQSFNFVV
jgi:hypothetical protein